MVILTVSWFFLQPFFYAEASGTAVVPIDWNQFNTAKPSGVIAGMAADILSNSNKYAVSVWWRQKGFAAQKQKYLNFGGKQEKNIRPAADEAFALAVSLKTGVYDRDKTGVDKAAAQKIAKRLAVSLAYWHKANKPNRTEKYRCACQDWGNSWQSALWSAKAGFAGWLLWDDLSGAEKKYIREMVLYEANRFNEYKMPYYRSAAGKLNYPGDSKAEENAWNGMILQLATAMMPNHPNLNIWRSKMLEFSISAFARPSDTESKVILHGRSISDWLSGSNVNEDGTVVNHKRVHPDYMTAITSNAHMALAYGLAGMAVPKAAFFNSEVVYQALSDGKLSGVSIYRINSSKIGYPKGNGWGMERRMNFALTDVEGAVFGFDKLSEKKGEYWALLHGQRVLNMQKRSKDGRTYQSAAEDTYPGREEWVADLAAQAYLTKWLQAQRKIKITNEKYPYVSL